MVLLVAVLSLALGSHNCSVAVQKVGMHGDGPLTTIRNTTLTACCALMWSNTTNYAAYTHHAANGACDLSGAPLSYHVSAGTQDAVSGCVGACPAAPTPASPFPGPPPPTWPAAHYPPALTPQSSTPPFRKPPRPNIVLFFGDDIGYGDLGSFGNPTSETPALDAMAADGAKLVQYYSAASICSPSRGSLMTGRNFVRLGIYPGVLAPTSNGGLPLSEVTVAMKLKSVGYRTAMIGKWHLGVREYHPTQRGFDEYYGAPMTQNECYSNLVAPGSTHKGMGFGPCPWFNGSSALPTWQSSGIFPNDPNAVDMINVDQFYDQSAAGFVRGAVVAKEPFFLYFASHHTHAPQFAKCQTSGDKEGDDAELALNCTTRRGLFGDSLALLDRSVDRMHALVEKLGAASNTLTIYSADNGGSLQWGILGGTNGDLRCGKGTLWEGGVRVPALVRWPGTVDPNTIVRELTSSLDWMPTFASLAGFELDEGKAYDGWDMSALLFTAAGQAAPAEAKRRDRFFYHTSGDEGGQGALVAVRLGAWKLHFITKGSHCDKTFPDAECYAPAHDRRDDGGLLFNVERDVSEVLPLSTNSFEYKQWAPVLWHMAADYASAFAPHVPPSQMTRGSSAERFPCCQKCEPMPTCCACNRTSPVY